MSLYEEFIKLPLEEREAWIDSMEQPRETARRLSIVLGCKEGDEMATIARILQRNNEMMQELIDTYKELAKRQRV